MLFARSSGATTRHPAVLLDASNAKSSQAHSPLRFFFGSVRKKYTCPSSCTRHECSRLRGAPRFFVCPLVLVALTPKC